VIFKPEMIDKILAREKTVTRRPVTLEDGGYGGAIFLPCRYEVGKHYAIQPGRGQKAVGRTRILDVHRKPLGYNMLTAECVREGFTHFTAFREYWTALYGDYDPTQLVDRIEFELLGAPEGKGR
jgi:hypothetical protein